MMIKRIIVSVVIMAAFVLTTAAAVSAFSNQDVEEARMKTMEVVVDFNDVEGHQSGMAWVYSPGYAITNAHVVVKEELDMKSLYLRSYDGEKYPADLIDYDLTNDIAILVFEGDVSPFDISDQAVTKGDAIMTIGPMFTQRFGTYFRDRSRLWVTPMVHFATNMIMSIPPKSGGSGGPIINEKGEIVGMMRGRVRGDSISLGVPLDRIKSFVKEIPNK